MRGISTLSFILLLLTAVPAAAQVRGISYTVSPLAERVVFDRNAGLANGFLYGGELGFGFGRYVELHALYLFNSDLRTDYSRLTGLDDGTSGRLALLDGRRIGFRRYGGTLKFNLLSGSTVPFLRLGTGLVRFSPDSLNTSRTIYLSAGAGVQFTFDGRYALMVGVENVAYRYNLGAAFFGEGDLEAGGLAPAYFNQTQVNNWVFRAGLEVYLGGREPEAETELDAALRRQLAGGLRGLSLRVEPFAGSVGFNDALPFRGRQRMLGLFAGLNIGPYVGLRGFYWRGAEDDVFDLDRLQAFGGELRFRFGDTAGITPSFTFGGGYLDVLSGYVGREDGVPVEDEPFLSAGVTASLPLGGSLSLSGGARTLLVSSEGFDNVNDPGDVYGSWLYSLGVRFSFGRERDRSVGGVLGTRLAATEAEASRSEAALREALARSQARLDSLAYVVALLQDGDTLALAQLRREAAEAGLAAVPDTTAVPPPAAATRPAVRTDRTITLPVPEEGELYVRFGRPGGVSIESVYGDPYVLDTTGVRLQGVPGAVPGVAAAPAAAPAAEPALSAEEIEQIVAQAVRTQLQESAAATRAAPQRLDELEDLLVRRLAEMEVNLQARLDRELRALQATQPTAPTVIVREGAQPATAAAPGETVIVATQEPAFDLRRVMPFVAFMYGDPILYAFGARADLLRLVGPLRLYPEFVLGLGDDNYAYHLNLDAVYAASFVERWLEGVSPYVGLGAGMLGFEQAPEDEAGVQLTVNLRLGTTFNFRNGRFFAEYATFDFFDYDRFALGYRIDL